MLNFGGYGCAAANGLDRGGLPGRLTIMKFFPHIATIVGLFLFAVIPSNFAQTDRKHIVLDHSPERRALPFSDCVVVGNTLYLSGHVGTDAKTGAVPASAKEEARLLMEDIKHTVEGAGMTIDDLVMVQVLCTDLDLFDTFNSVYRTYFHGGFPARAFMGCSKLLFGAHFEITAIAVKR